MASEQADQNERQQTENVLRTFVGEDGRLARLPAHRSHEVTELRRVAEEPFETGVDYPERLVDERLRVWCEAGAEAA